MSLDPTPPSTPNPGAPRAGWIGPYQILGGLGHGASGQVFHVRDAAGRELALKLLGTVKPESVRRFEREGRVTASLRHSGIVAVHAAGTVGDRPYLVYELVSGASLEDRLPTLDRPTRLRLIQEVAEAVGYAHSQGVLHRDLKPENVVVDAAGHARVVDFGLAQVAGSKRVTQTGAWIGSPMYMSPEQIAGERSRFGPATDVWALGVMLYLALSDRVPFDAQTVVELIAQVTSSPPRRCEDATRRSPRRSKPCACVPWPRPPSSASPTAPTSPLPWPRPATSLWARLRIPPQSPSSRSPSSPLASCSGRSCSEG